MLDLSRTPATVSFGPVKLPASIARLAVAWVFVTPAMAAWLLANAGKMNFKNRALSCVYVTRYRHDMLNDAWHSATGEPIQLACEKGVLFPLNGYHRLSALADARVRGIWMLVIGNVDRAMFKYFDNGRARDLPQIMEVSYNESGNTHWIDYTNQATTVRLLWAEHSTGNPTKKPSGDKAVSDATVFDYAEEHWRAELDAFWYEHGCYLKKIQKGPIVDGQRHKGYGPVGVIAYVGLRASKLDPLRWAAIEQHMADPLNVPAPSKHWEELRAALTELAAEMVDQKEKRIMKGRHKDYSEALLRMWVLAWNRDREGAPTRKATRKGRWAESIYKDYETALLLDENTWTPLR